MEIKRRFKEIYSWITGSYQNENKFYQEIKESFTINGKLIYIGDLLKVSYQRYKNKTAIIYQNYELTYSEFYYRSLLLSRKLRTLGISSSDKVLLYCDNSANFYIVYFAILQTGAVVVPVNIFLHQKELAYVIKDSEVSAAYVSNVLMDSWDKLLLSGYLEKIPNLITEKDIDWSSKVPDVIDENLFNFSHETRNPDELSVLLYTSGTTGQPKGVMLSSRNILTNAMQAYARLKLFGEYTKDRFFSVLPLFHVFAQTTCIWLPVITGSAVIVVNKIDRKMILDGLNKKPTIFFGFPGLFGLLCLFKTAPLDSVRIFVSGADMLPDKIRSAFAMIYGRKICSGYGLTEASPVVAFNNANDSASTEVVGKPLVGIECDIRGLTEESLKFGESGDLWIHGDNVMLGYYKAPEATAKILKNGWLNTGDCAILEKNGRLYIRGRSKDLIIHKGFNIYPQEIENVLMTHPNVVRAAVIGKEEAISGQIPVAFVQIKSREMNNNIEDSLKELCASNLAQYKIPRKFFCLDDLPINSTGKVDKKKLQI